MKCWALRIVLLLVLGVVTTVAVAWGAVLWAPWDLSRPWDNPYVSIVADQAWPLRTPDGWPERAVIGRIDRFWMTEVSASGLIGEDVVDQRQFRSGVPIQSMYRVVHFGLTRHRPPANWREGLRIPQSLSWIHRRNPDHYLLPLIPIWPGLAINTLFYGVIWFGIFLAFGSTRRAIRKKRGRCPKCNYDLRGDLDHGCPECGWGRG